MRKKVDLCFVILLLSMMKGCIQPVEITPPEKRAVIVKSILMYGATPTVELYYSGAVGGTHFDPVEDAQVMISTRAGNVYQLNYEKDGRYRGGFLPNPGQSYHLTVLVPGRDTITATTTIPEKFEMMSAFFPPEEWLEDSDQVLRSLYIPELSKPDFPIYDFEEYYRIYPWAFSKSGKAIEEMRSKGGSSMLDLMPGMVFSMVSSWPRVMYIIATREEGGKMVQAKHLATNHRLVDNDNLGDKMYHSEDNVTSEPSLRQQFEREIGTHYEGLPLHDDYLRIVSDGDYDNGLGRVYRLVYRGSAALPDDYLHDASSFFTVVGDFPYNYWGEDREGLHASLYFCSVSEEYDLYLQDCHRQIASMKGDILTSLYSNATNNYTNVHGGFGIFGAMYVLRHDCDQERRPGMVPPIMVTTDYYGEYPPYPAQLPEL